MSKRDSKERSRKKAGEAGGRRAADPVWQFFPLYGLIISQDDGLASPLWRDATLVARGKAIELIKQQGVDPNTAALFAGGRIADVVSIENVGNPESRIEIVPHSFIAVRGARGGEVGARRAEEVRAILSSTMFLRGSRNTAFCGSPHEFAWYIASTNFVLQDKKAPQSSFTPKVNPHIVQKPLTVAKPSLRASVLRGLPVTPELSAWDMHAELPICRLLNLTKPSRLELRLIQVARQLQRAACATSNSTRLQLAVAAWETLMNSDSFSDLEKRIGAFFPDDSRLDDILKARHKLTHESFSPLEKDFEKSSGNAVAMGWILLDVGVAASQDMSAAQFDEYTKVQAQALELDRRVQRLAGLTGEDGGMSAALHARVTLRTDGFSGRQSRDALEASSKNEAEPESS